MRPENRELLAKLGRVVYLRCAPDALLGRMEAKGLPLFLRDDSSLERLTEIWIQRHAIYEAMADVTVDNSSIGLEETVSAVLAALKRPKE